MESTEGGPRAAGPGGREAAAGEKEKEKEKETFIVPIMELKVGFLCACAWTGSLMHSQDKFNRMLRESFAADPAFARVQNQSFEAALNSSRHTPE